MEMPSHKPRRPFFSCGPCVKPPGWSPSWLQEALISRLPTSHAAQKRVETLLEEARDVLHIPSSHVLLPFPGSATTAMGCLLWTCLGPRPVDVFSWDFFGAQWAHDIVSELKLKDVRHFSSCPPQLSPVPPSRDVVFTWNGTTRGIAVPSADFISQDRTGLSLCDATSAFLTVDLPWDKLDATAWSWQKASGAEAGLGMLCLSPRALDRLATWTPPWPLPTVFSRLKTTLASMKKGGRNTINTHSFLVVEDVLSALRWVKECGGLPEMIKRTAHNISLMEEWVASHDYVTFLCQDPVFRRSSASPCLVIDHGNAIADLLETHQMAYDIQSHESVGHGLRIWVGPTVDPNDLTCLLSWIDWAYATSSGT